MSASHPIRLGLISRYLTYHQLQVTLILVALAQSVHELTPPDVLTPVVRKLAQEFVHPGVGSEVVAAGINAIREVCRRQPWCMEEDLLGDLIEYRKSKDKGVVTAARGLLQLFRETNPGLLKRRERGKAAAMGEVNQAPAFGHTKQTAEGIEGIELLEEHFAALRKEANGGASDESDVEIDEDDEKGWENWDVESDSSDSSSGWEEVSSDGDDLEISDSEDERPKAKKAKLAAVDEEDEEASDAEMDDAKSVVSAAPSAATTAVSESTKKLSMLAQQKVRFWYLMRTVDLTLRFLRLPTLPFSMSCVSKLLRTWSNLRVEPLRPSASSRLWKHPNDTSGRTRRRGS